MRSKESKSKIEQYHLHKSRPEKLQFEVYSLNEYRKNSGKMASVPHSHSYYQIIWFFHAGGFHCVDFKTYEIKEHTVMFVSKDQIHAFDDNLEVEGWLVHFNESFFMHSDVDVFLKYNIFDTSQTPCYFIDHNTIKTADTYFSLIQGELSNKQNFGYEEVIRFLLKSLLINFERVNQKDGSKKLKLNSAYELQYFKFKELIEHHYKHGLAVSEYAILLNISSKTLSTITRTVVDKPPSSLITERVVLEAERLLKFTSLQIGEIAYKLGFDDISYFVKYFKKHVGQAPGLYRNQVSIQ